jgi:hypothetical protein
MKSKPDKRFLDVMSRDPGNWRVLNKGTKNS